MKKVVMSLACVLGFSAAAHAAQIASPAIFGAHTQVRGTCTALNGGSTPITVTLKIVTESGTVIDTTTETLVPGDFMVVSENIASGVAYACVASAGASLANVRAAMFIEERIDINGNSVQRPIRSAALR